jgi:hypothetical protein
MSDIFTDVDCNSLSLFNFFFIVLVEVLNFAKCNTILF